MSAPKILWRDTGRRVGFAGLDAWCLAPLAVWFFRPSWWTCYGALGGTLLFMVLEVLGVSIKALGRRILCWIIGKDRSGTPTWRRRYFA